MSNDADPIASLLTKLAPNYVRGVVSQKRCVTVFTLLLLSLLQIPCPAQQSGASFQNIALRLAHQFASSKDLRTLHCVSQYGLTISERGVAPSEISEMKIPDVLDPGAKLEPHRIIEDSVDVDSSQYNQSPNKAVIARARSFVLNNLGGPPIFLQISQSAKDKWGKRLLGPAVVGKVAAGTYWYLYLRKEHGTWRIWKFELDE